MLKSLVDQLGDTITINFPPKRILSLVPSQTELLADLGLETSVVGITKFCVHPSSWRASKTIIGGTKNFNYELIAHVNPDLIIGNKEENYQEGIAELKKDFPVWMSDITSYQQALAMIEHVGVLTDRYENAVTIVDRVESAFRNLKKRKARSVLYLIWRKPWMAAANSTFINTMLEMIGLTNCVTHQQRYPVLSEDDITLYAPELVFLSSEPYPFRDVHIQEVQAIAPHAKIVLVDGEMFSWYGSRMALSPAYFNSLPLE